MKLNGRIIWDTTKSNARPHRKLNTSLAQKEFGFYAKVDFQPGLCRKTEWYRKHPQQEGVS